MTLVTRELNSGLTVAEEAQDEKMIARALKQIDERYVLQKHPSEVEGGWVYKVFCIVSEDQPAICIHTWCDDRGNPLPLSTGLLEDVKRWRPDARERRGFDADEHNRRLDERLAKDRAADMNALGEEHAVKIEKGRTTVSLSDATPPRFRNKRPPQSSGIRRR
jgi:hypothetical protein